MAACLPVCDAGAVHFQTACQLLLGQTFCHSYTAQRLSKGFFHGFPPMLTHYRLVNKSGKSRRKREKNVSIPHILLHCRVQRANMYSRMLILNCIHDSCAAITPDGDKVEKEGIHYAQTV